MSEETSVLPLMEGPYILVRILGVGDDDVKVEFEHSGFKNREAAMDFLKAVVENSEEA